jgi:hypothetical protein
MSAMLDLMNEVEQALLAHAVRQHGLVTRDQALTAGLSRRSIERRVATGAWRRAAPGVYASTPFEATWEQSVLSEVLAGGFRAASHATAAFLLGLYRSVRPSRTEVTVVRGDTVPTTVHRRETLWLPEDEVVERASVPVTSPARTIVDLAHRWTLGHLIDVLHDSIRRDLTTPDEVLDVGHRRPRLNGIVRLREAVEALHPDAALLESPLEVAGLSFLRTVGLAPPHLQHEVTGPSGRVIARLDAAWPERGVAVEFDGAGFHSTPRDAASDRRRDRRLAILGWHTVRLGWSDLRLDRRNATAERVRRALAGR